MIKNIWYLFYSVGYYSEKPESAFKGDSAYRTLQLLSLWYLWPLLANITGIFARAQFFSKNVAITLMLVILLCNWILNILILKRLKPDQKMITKFKFLEMVRKKRFKFGVLLILINVIYAIIVLVGGEYLVSLFFPVLK